MNICVRISSQWTSSTNYVTPAMRDAYSEYKERPHYYREKPYRNSEYIVYRPDNDPYLPTYIVRIADDIPVFNDGNEIITQMIHERIDAQGRAIPIIDINDIYVFITDSSVVGAAARANWLPARSYQAWAYRDFMYDRNRSIKKSYVSRNTHPSVYITDDRILSNQIVTIPITDIDVNIVFTMGRNENNSVYIERNGPTGSRTRICDNEYARTGYLGFYTRITMDPGVVVIPPSGPSAGPSLPSVSAILSTAHLPAPEETDDIDHQCITCLRYRVNMRFSPCEHTVCCSTCYSQFSKNQCPVCRALITRVMDYSNCV